MPVPCPLSTRRRGAALNQYCVDRTLLPPARNFYEQQGYKLGRASRSDWTMARGVPPCHESKSGKSLSVNLTHGGWHCFGCGEHGDMVSFVMRRDGCGFREAAKTLGIWRAGLADADRHEIARREELRRRHQQEQIEQRERERQERVSLARYLRAAERLYREGIAEHSFELMAEMLSRVRQLGEQYYKLCGLGAFEI